MVTTPLSVNKSPTKDIVKGTNELAYMPFTEKKNSTKDVEKGNNELAFMKQAVVTIFRKGLYQFEGQSKGSKRWFKLDSGLLKTTFSTIHSELHKKLLKGILNIKTQNCIQRLLFRLMNNLSRKI